ncbi:MAG: MFS transporter [Rubritepida sp.]|jgi:MFS family permease|nr:MFS transporter [Rubritepida sp.]
MSALPRGLPAAATRSAPTLDRGWRVVAGAFLVTMVGYGAIYSYAAFAEEIAAAFGASRASVTMVYALSGSACFFVGALTGPLADRIGARALAAIGMLLVAAGFLLAAAAETLIEVYLGYGLLVGLGAGCAYVPAMALVQRWFRVHRGLASGLAVSGIGMGTALVPPGAAALFALGDWRIAFLGCAALSLAVGLAGAALLAPAPGDEAGFETAAAPTPPPVVATRGFAWTYAGVLLVSLPAVLPHALLVASARDMGLPAGEALALLGLIGLGTIAGRFLLALLADAVGRRLVFLLCCAGMSLSMLAWAWGTDEATLQAFALAFGALQGGFVALLPAFTADRFGPRGLGGVLGVLYTARGLALLLAPPAVAAVAVALAAPGPALLAAAGLGVAGTVLLVRSRA